MIRILRKYSSEITAYLIVISMFLFPIIAVTFVGKNMLRDNDKEIKEIKQRLELYEDIFMRHEIVIRKK